MRKIKIFFYIFTEQLYNRIVQNYIRNKSCQKFNLNNIDIQDQPSRMHRSPPRSRQNFPDSKNSKIWEIWQIFQIWSYSVLIEIKVVRNNILSNMFRFEKIQRKDNFDRQKYFRFDHIVFWSKQKLSEMVF